MRNSAFCCTAWLTYDPEQIELRRVRFALIFAIFAEIKASVRPPKLDVDNKKRSDLSSFEVNRKRREEQNEQQEITQDDSHRNIGKHFNSVNAVEFPFAGITCVLESRLQ